MPFNYAAQRLRAHRMIARYGGSENNAAFRLNGTDTPCTAVEIGFEPQPGRLETPTTREMLVSAQGLGIVPTQRHSFVWPTEAGGEEVLRIVEKPKRIAPSPFVVMWQVRVSG